MTFTDWGIGGKSTYFKIELVLDLTYTTIRLLLQPFLWLYTPEIHSKTALLNEWMDNGNKTFHLFLIIHDQTTNYVCLTTALCTTSSHREFWSEEAHCITISATDYQSSIKLILKNYHCSWWLLLYGPFIFFFNFVFRILRRHQQHTKLRHPVMFWLSK